jgi:hypothetical protein
MRHRTHDLVERYRASGLTQQAFCAKQAVPHSTLQYHLAIDKRAQALRPAAPQFIPITAAAGPDSARTIVMLRGHFKTSEILELLNGTGA